MISNEIVNKVGNLSEDIVVQGSRAAGTASVHSDIDIAIKLNNKEFSKFLGQRFKNVNVGSANEKTFIRAFQSGKIQAGEADLSSLGKKLEGLLKMKLDISVIRESGPFDNGSQIPLTGTKTP